MNSKIIFGKLTFIAELSEGVVEICTARTNPILFLRVLWLVIGINLVDRLILSKIRHRPRILHCNSRDWLRACGWININSN